MSMAMDNSVVIEGVEGEEGIEGINGDGIK